MTRMARMSLFAIIILSLSAFMAACGNSNTEEETSSSEGTNTEESDEVNLYTSRHYETDQALYDAFTEETGIKVNVVEGKGDELMERLNQEGESTEADLFITADAGNLYQASQSDLLQPVESDVLNENIPEKFRDVDNEWFGLTKRARVMVYDKERVDPSELSTYEALTESEWEDRIAIRSSSNMYNISLLASLIELNGSEEASAWAEGIVNNMAIEPQGGDRDQAKAVAAGQADVAIMNSYYLGAMLNSEDPEEVKVAESLGIFFPNQETTGTHVNISGIAMTKHAKNTDNAVKLMEFLSNEASQEKFSAANYEYPVNPNVEASELLQSWGEFKEQEIPLSVLGENQQEAILIFDKAGWK